MRKFVIAASAAAAMFAASSANAMQASGDLAAENPVQKIGLCFYVDGWNGPGFYDCGFRWNRGHGWHGKRHDGGHHSGGKSHKGGKKKH